MRALYLTVLALIGAIISPALQANVTSAQARASGNVTRLNPISEWNIDYGDNRCRLLRVFGTKEEPHVLFFVQSAPGSSFSMTLARPASKPCANSRRSYLGLRDDAIMRKLDLAGRGTVNGFGAAMILSSFALGQTAEEEAAEEAQADVTPKMRSAGIDLRKAETAESVTLKLNRRVLSFETGPMKAPFEALNTCTGSMMAEWGLDAERHQNYRPAQLTNAKAVARAVANKYPRKALNKGESAIFQMRMIVEPDGKASNCHLEQNTIADNLDSPACQIAIATAEFEPARDAEGQTLRSFYTTSVTYSINP